MVGSEIVNLVITKLEERSAFLNPNSGMGPLLSGDDSLNELNPVYSYINSHLAESANEVLMIAPLNHLIPTDITDNVEATPNDDGTGKIEIPEDYLRLYTLKMEDWAKPVHEAIGKGHPIYSQQFNKYTRGIPEKPVVVYSGTATTPYLNYYSVYTSHEINELSYIPRFSEVNEYTDKMSEAIALNTAKKVMEVFGNTEGVAIMQNELTSVLGNMQL